MAAKHLRVFSLTTTILCFNRSSHSSHSFFGSFGPYPFHCKLKTSQSLHAKKRESRIEPSIMEGIGVEEEEEEEEIDDGFFGDEFEDGDAGDSFLDNFELDEAELHVGDGAGGGGISLAGTTWDKEALALAEKALLSFDGELKIYAFRTLLNSTIQVRIETLSNRSGSPSMMDIENFSAAYRAELNEAEVAGSIPTNISLEVSSPGVERVVQIPQELERFKDRPMYVEYITDEATATGTPAESDGVFKLVSYDLESNCCTWALADVKVNRQKAGKGRPMNKKQREWRLNTPFHCLRLVRLHSDI
ncbi:hypothetical protein Syun_013917 [Stephania yunnanensis]|uniref:DUF7912 domain-containing protein n=1 Tax=Stephania yunnanensis TaxID=152371 RepID=A0AAP0P874_9MAGN